MTFNDGQVYETLYSRYASKALRAPIHVLRLNDQSLVAGFALGIDFSVSIGFCPWISSSVIQLPCKPYGTLLRQFLATTSVILFPAMIQSSLFASALASSSHSNNPMLAAEKDHYYRPILWLRRLVFPVIVRRMWLQRVPLVPGKDHLYRGRHQRLLCQDLG